MICKLVKLGRVFWEKTTTCFCPVMKLFLGFPFPPPCSLLSHLSFCSFHTLCLAFYLSHFIPIPFLCVLLFPVSCKPPSYLQSPQTLPILIYHFFPVLLLFTSLAKLGSACTDWRIKFTKSNMFHSKALSSQKQNSTYALQLSSYLLVRVFQLL